MSYVLCENLQRDLSRLGFQGHISRRRTQLSVQLSDRPGLKQASAIATLHHWFVKLSTEYPELQTFQTIEIAAYRQGAKPIWQQTIPMPGAQATFAEHDFTSFHSRVPQLWGYPLLLIAAFILSHVSIAQVLLRGVTIWFHEFGHATVAWLAGRKALPLPLGWTNVEPEKSWFVYGGILILLILLGWAGHREQRRWPVVLAIAIALLQFVMTWWMPTDWFELLMAFGGVGGEFYLCTLCMVSFFFPLPAYFRWEIYRYPAVFGAAYTFWGSLTQWHQIRTGTQSIPWGSLWGGADHQGGDMNILSHQFGWSDQQIIQTYTHLGGTCLTVIIAVYLYFLWKQQRSRLILFWNQCLASYWS